ncbi:MAG: FAD-dependent oxidoreductase [Actinomycetota bacterium]|nr:FAD-dependent oxidoreductase [Actinomycetota bacterium]
MTREPDCEVLVVGAGLAGLQCAGTLERAGVDVQVVEAADGVGGRVATETVDGFLVDRGFQLLNPAYPAVRRWVDVDALGLQQFAAGVGVRREDRLEDRLVVLADPRREPSRLVATLRSGLVRPAEVARLVRWLAPALGPPSRLTSGSGDLSLRESLDATGADGSLRHTVLDPFLAGVLLEDEGSSSAGFARLLLRSFLLGSPGLPREGMQALPRQLAGRLSRLVRTGVRVDRVDQGEGVATVHGEYGNLTARYVVVATGPAAAAELTGIPRPEVKGVVTHWFTTPQAPTDLPMLVLDGRQRWTGGVAHGPVINTAVISAAAPSYAPPGRHLVQASSLLGGRRGIPGDAEVLAHLSGIYGVSVSDWELLARHDVPEALPAQPPPLVVRKPVRVSESVLVCGDHRDTASLQGALVSGQRTAQGLVEALGSGAGR